MQAFVKCVLPRVKQCGVAKTDDGSCGTKKYAVLIGPAAAATLDKGLAAINRPLPRQPGRKVYKEFYF